MPVGLLRTNRASPIMRVRNGRSSDFKTVTLHRRATNNMFLFGLVYYVYITTVLQQNTTQLVKRR